MAPRKLLALLIVSGSNIELLIESGKKLSIKWRALQICWSHSLGSFLGDFDGMNNFASFLEIVKSHFNEKKQQELEQIKLLALNQEKAYEINRCKQLGGSPDVRIEVIYFSHRSHVKVDLPKLRLSKGCKKRSHS
ncbi:hypothetical protein Xen7305DRAFT_00040200 [Xenococcus sp. PCC 7305]|uniref:hypothetical protein n=1 Tax=Xenococcus sp. PCC 7305 TaxID=102125 RepID=UPI0002ACB71D|nr:hypothetical protein [Xenococcus sp. PCC 7305]ELS04291.1 hypothetical protein Xen7305DRAFT_00040200 [Xenococcus sp. PCC 7305]